MVNSSSSDALEFQTSLIFNIFLLRIVSQTEFAVAQKNTSVSLSSCSTLTNSSVLSAVGVIFTVTLYKSSNSSAMAYIHSKPKPASVTITFNVLGSLLFCCPQPVIQAKDIMPASISTPTFLIIFINISSLFYFFLQIYVNL